MFDYRVLLCQLVVLHVDPKLWGWCRCSAAVRSGEKAAQAAAAAHAQVAYAPADAFLQQANGLLIAKLQAACLIRLEVVNTYPVLHCHYHLSAHSSIAHPVAYTSSLGLRHSTHWWMSCPRHSNLADTCSSVSIEAVVIKTVCTSCQEVSSPIFFCTTEHLFVVAG